MTEIDISKDASIRITVLDSGCYMKKMKSIKSRYISIAYIVTALLICVSVVSAGSVGFIISNYLLQNITDNAVNGAKTVIEKIEQNHTTQVSMITTLGSSIARMVEVEHKKPAPSENSADYYQNVLEKYEKEFQIYLENSPGFIHSIYLYYDVEYTNYTHNLKLFRRDDEIVVQYNESRANYDAISGAEGSRNWYHTVKMETHGPTWITGSYDRQENLISPFLVPVYDGDELVCIVGIDLNLNAFTKMVGEQTLFETGYVFLLDNEGVVVIHKQAPMLDTLGATVHAAEGNLDEIIANNDSGEVINVASSVKGEYFLFKRLSNGWTVGGTYYMNEVTSSYDTVKIFILVVIASVIGLIFLLSIFLQRLIKKKMDMVLDVLDSVKRGDFTKRVDIKTNNEIGILSEGINRMIEEIRVLVSNVSTVSNYVAETSESLGESMNQTDEVFKRIQGSVQKINDDIMAQATSTEEISASMDNFRISFRHLNTISNAVASEADDAVKKNDQWMQNIQVLGETSQKRISSTEDVETSINQLGQRAREINAIVGIISDIVEQTNLLALNASIEAARAGETGKGFAVVAEEVRSLAEQSQKEASNIQQIVNNINDETTNTATYLSYLRENTRKEKEALINADLIFKEIYSSFDLITQKIQDLNAKIDDMNRIQENVSRGVSGISDSADQNALSVESISASVNDEGEIIKQISDNASELKKLSVELRDVIGRFVM